MKCDDYKNNFQDCNKKLEVMKELKVLIIKKNNIKLIIIG